MGEFVAVGNEGEVGEGEILPFDARGVRVAIANVDGTLYAFDDTCTHRGCSLSEGDLEETTIVCACHGGSFDVSTGDPLTPPTTEPIQVYPVRERDGMLEVDISE